MFTNRLGLTVKTAKAIIFKVVSIAKAENSYKESEEKESKNTPIYNHEKMYTYIKSFATRADVKETLKARSYAREKHSD